MDVKAREELKSITQTILKTVNAVGIYLFGSYADGIPDQESDFDIYVIIPDDSMRPIEAMQKIGSAVSQQNIRAVDIVVGKESVFQRRKLIPSMERIIFNQGVKLYG